MCTGLISMTNDQVSRTTKFAVGSKPDSDDLLRFVSVDLATNTTCDLSWSGEQMAYVTVAAFNEEGGRITAASDGVKVMRIDDNSGLVPEHCVSWVYHCTHTLYTSRPILRSIA
jgi:hypothetical protein